MSWREALGLASRDTIQELEEKVGQLREELDAERDRTEDWRDSLSILLEVARSTEPGAQLYLGEEAKERARQFREEVRQVSLESAQLPGGPVPRALIHAIMWTESHWNPVAQGPDTRPDLPGPQSAYGLMQIFHTNFGAELDWPATAGVTVTESNWTVPLVNLRAGVSILLGCGWGREGNPTREVFRCYSGALSTNTEAINSYTTKIYNRFSYLSLGPRLGLTDLEV